MTAHVRFVFAERIFTEWIVATLNTRVHASRRTSIGIRNDRTAR